jgi:hypothetical protein
MPAARALLERASPRGRALSVLRFANEASSALRVRSRYVIVSAARG